MRTNGLESSLLKYFFLLFLFVLLVSYCAPEQEADAVRWITFEELAQSLEGQPAMSVGFDIDDTLLFSSPGFYYGREKYSPGNRTYSRLPEFWEEMNNGLDRFSLPKAIARKLIELHQERGDTLYFITGRPPAKTETLTDLLGKTFGVENPNPVIFTGNSRAGNAKIEPLEVNGIKIFYGDSDGDIEAAQAVGARAIRVLRAGNSTSPPVPNPGHLGEEVLADSEY